MIVGLKSIPHPADLAQPTESGGLISWPHNLRAREFSTQDVPALFVQFESWPHDGFGINYRIGSPFASLVSWPHDASNSSFTVQSLTELVSWPHDATSADYRVNDPLATQDPPVVVVPPPDRTPITFTCDFSGLLCSTGATVSGPATIATNGKQSRIAADFAAAPITSVAFDTSQFQISPRGPNPKTADFGEIERDASNFAGSYSSGLISFAVFYHGGDAGATITGSRSVGITFNDVQCPLFYAGFECYSPFADNWVAHLERTGLCLQNNYAVSVRSLNMETLALGSTIAALAPWDTTQMGVGMSIEVWPRIYGGTWTATIGAEVATIPWNANVGDIAALLNALPTVATRGGVRVEMQRADESTRSYWDMQSRIAYNSRVGSQVRDVLPVTYQTYLAIRQNL